MSISDIFLLVVRWLHLIAAAAWVGGSIFYLVVLRPALRRSPDVSRQVNDVAAREFRALVDTSIFVLPATGIILTVNRLTPNTVGSAYVIALGVKIALSVWMFVLARQRQRRTPLLESVTTDVPEAVSGFSKVARAVSGYNSIVILGVIVFLVSDLLKVLFELTLAQAPISR